ncbi:MAG: hypothetical protein ACKVQA_18550, partial [Burkholderiales bacterium]
MHYRALVFIFGGTCSTAAFNSDRLQRTLMLSVLGMVLSIISLDSFSATIPRRVTLSVDHADIESDAPVSYLLSTEKSQKPISLHTEEIRVEEPVDSEITLEILHPNQILYIYTKGEISREKTSTSDSLDQFTKTLQSFGKSAIDQKKALPLGAPTEIKATRQTPAGTKCTESYLK